METNQDEKQNITPRRNRRHSLRQEKDRDRFLFVRNILNVIFMVLAIIGVVFYLTNHTETGIIIVLVAMGFKMIECILRFIK